jgi:integrase/recombinase XerD
MKKTIKLQDTSNADKLYHYSELIGNSLKIVEEDKKIIAVNKKHIKEFISYCNSAGLGKARLTIYLGRLKVIGRMFNKDFEKATRKDIEDLLEEVIAKYTNSGSRALFIMTIKKLWGNYFNNMELVSWLKISKYNKQAQKESKNKRIENILTPEEVEEIIGVADNPRDKAFIGVLYYSGCRIGEIINLKIKHIKFKDFVTEINVYGKTGTRVIPIVECSKLLQNWIDAHGNKDNKEAYVWINIGTTKTLANLKNYDKFKKKDVKPKYNYGEHISIRRATDILQNAGKRVKINKKLNPHNFRHSRLTYLATKLTESELKNFAGWTQGSKEAGTYVHLSGRDVSNSMNKIYGIKKAEERENELFKCWRCNWLNRRTLTICENCGLALASEKAVTLDKKTQKHVSLNKVMKVLLEDDIFKKFLARYLIDKNMVEYAKQLAEEEK